MTVFARSDFLKRSGALTIGFSIAAHAKSAQAAHDGVFPGLYGPPEDRVDSWIAVDRTGTVTLYSGCCELGTGSSTGLLQIMAEELDVPMQQVRFRGPDTDRTVDQFVSSGSRTIEFHSVPIRNAAAEARLALVGLASKALGVPADDLMTHDGAVLVKDDPTRSIGYAALIGNKQFDVTVTGKAQPKPSSQYSIVGTSVPRKDLPAKILGTFSYVHDVKLPGMLHGRIIRPPAHGASVVGIDASSITHFPGLIKVVREHDLVGVVCEREEQAIRAAGALKIHWTSWAGLPPMNDLYKTVRTLPEAPDAYPKNAKGGVTTSGGDLSAGFGQAKTRVSATYEVPYHHHGSIGPSCAVADVRSDGVTVWSGTQTPFGLRDAVAKFLGSPLEKVRLIYAEAAGCYGQNGADDVVIDAVVLSRSVGKPVRVQWSRADENGWEGCKGARVADMSGGVDGSGNIVAWQGQAFGFSAYSRPEYHEPEHGGEPGPLVTAVLAGWNKPGFDDGFAGAASHFDVPYANVKNKHMVFKYLGSPSHRAGALRIRVASMRGVGGPDSIFAVESFIDELAAAAKADPVEFRLRHDPGPRGTAVIKAAAAKAGWQSRPAFSSPGKDNLLSGRGVAFVGSNRATNTAAIFDVTVDRTTGKVRVKRITVALEPGLIVNPDAVTNQVEGCVLQATSRAFEEVKFNASRITTLEWRSYPILTFEDLPDAVDVVLLNRPDLRPTGIGELANNIVWAALANAIYDATGVRVRTMPFTPDRVLAALQRGRSQAS